MTSLKTFMVNHAVHSKISSEPVVTSWNKNILVFINGFPMTRRGFTMLASKAILNSDIKMHPAWWEELHQETAILCQMLPVTLSKGREAFAVLQGVRDHLKERKVSERNDYLKWVADIENRMWEETKGE